MAVRTASATGLWSSTNTWGSNPVPASGDSAVINAGVVVTFDVNQSAFASGIAGITNSGELRFITDGTVTYLKASGNISGAGSLFIGNSDLDPIPAPSGATPEVATLAFNGAFGITMTGIVECHGELRTPFVAIASKTDNTHIVVAADGPTFRAGDILQISNSTIIGRNSSGTETFTVSAYNAGTREITLGSSLARSVNQNSVTDYVVLLSRNILITNLANVTLMFSGTDITLILKGVRFSRGTAGGAVLNAATGQGGPGSSQGVWFDYCCLDGSVIQPASLISSVSTLLALVNHSVFANPSSNVNLATNTTFRNSIVINGSTAFSGDLGNLTLAILDACLALNCVVGLGSTNQTVLFATDCIAYNCSTGSTMANSILRNCIFAHNTVDTSNLGNELYNCLFSSLTEFAVNTNQVYTNTQSYDHDQVAGSFRGAMAGGVVTSVSSPVYDSTRVRSYQHAPASTLNACFMRRVVNVPAGGSVYVRCYVRKDSSMSYLPRLWVYSADKQPLITGSPDAEVIMTDSVDTWEVLTATVTNSTDAPKQYIVLTVAKSGSGNVFFDPIVRTSSFIPSQAMEGALAA